MPTYRLEEASTGRAGCKNKECQDNKIKILKGELRFGSWVETEQFQTWHWKHWGCVTPKQIAGLHEVVGDGDDYSLLDGYDDLSAENQGRVREAIAGGHVADSDWRGDVEVNRPGKIGFRARVSKKKKNDTDDVEKGDSPKKGKRSRSKKTVEEEGHQEKEPASKRPKTSSSGQKAEEAAVGSQDNAPDPPKSLSEPKAKGRRKRENKESPGKQVPGVGDGVEKTSSQSRRKSRPRAAKVVDQPIAEAESKGDAVATAKPKRTRKNAT